MSAGPSRPKSARSLSREEEAQPPTTSTNEQTPLLPSDQTKPHHRLLGIQVPLWLPRRYIAVFMAFIGMMAVLLVSALFIDPIWRRQRSVFMNNGTHDFRKTVVVISFDGFRADYLHRGLTPNLLATGDSGLPNFLFRFPHHSNHWSIMTGLYPESHGIIANEFIEPETGAHSFTNTQTKVGMRTGGVESHLTERIQVTDLTRPGPPVTRNDHKPTYFVPFRVISFIRIICESLIDVVIVYEPLIDDVGHMRGPDSPEMTEALMDIDVFAHSVRAGLSSRNLSSIVDVIFLSDHGMAPTHDRKWIYLDDILGEEGANEIDWKLGQPSAGLWFHPGANVTRHLEKLYRASARPPHNFKVYTATSDVWPNVYKGVEIPQALQNPFPPHKHFSPDHNSRIPPIYVVPELGWSVTWHREKDPWYANGDHGYDNEDPLMRAMFIASGPFTDRVRAKVFAQAEAQPATTPPSNRFTRSSPAPAIYAPPTHNSTWKPPIYVPPRGGSGPVLIERFQNVEVYGLVMRLLGIRAQAAQTNGTDGFWDEWFDRM
ncbi:alkaline-phosphatase-like protein [Rhizoctonia solani]|nr:alkaline-phosphatase-like protein [Rhizoctonia solani]